eukprot:CAMPEP_0198210614 /NCGR_PEP_ID=MMETSP1445-20131203/21083_1 /TAXON_ID=36898 /ORGANISM="Pyramimonas sp., Strain CCMP2087" /LENGTH=112 /DNA_ID=CAMNT_0043884717 /DNA_START=58 /DNA_END=396 /DNA_ORIENTATION=-
MALSDDKNPIKIPEKKQLLFKEKSDKPAKPAKPDVELAQLKEYGSLEELYAEKLASGHPCWTFNWGLCIVVSITVFILAAVTFVAAGGIASSNIGKDWGSAPGSLFDTSDRK